MLTKKKDYFNNKIFIYLHTYLYIFFFFVTTKKFFRICYGQMIILIQDLLKADWKPTAIYTVWKTDSIHDASLLDLLSSFEFLCMCLYCACIVHVYVYSKYARQTMTKEAKNLGYEDVDAKNCYMIGDNVYSDIAGGNSIGWNTILVKTGVYNDTHAFDGNPTLKCENVKEAVDYIFKRHL
ncbi:hypothetical protein RFI_24229 [Reticulomyxa filosa]|uniref:Uncharacterized protein n=1 Tax=Reticulomyxa filosa TaxID=46433 RepID=X6MGK3_RETFI|nr:hypothetical protein RFI_24229 [Reticulomyxa filosa]|eukprot:ETO13148.1 hypothetical protein RFI_24229 [Reticulomyxa filosa]